MQASQTPEPAAPVPTFDRCVTDTLNEALAVCEQRSGEYRDSWDTEHLHTPVLDNLMGDLGFAFTREEMRLIALASMIDIKLSRLVGPYKRDTLIDLINYTACYAQLREEYNV